MFSVNFSKIFKNSYFCRKLRTAASEKQQMNYRFNIKNGVTENFLNYLPGKSNKKDIVTKVCTGSTKQLFLKI